jgi:NADH-quinone oxidoreductase subunit E
MASEELRAELKKRIAQAGHPRELAVDVMYALQRECGWLNDAALAEGAALLGMTPLEMEELATFYDFIYREPVGRYVIHVCDGVVCWMQGYASVRDHLREKLGIEPGASTPDWLFTLLSTGCIGFCDHAPAMLINGELYGRLTPERIDAILEELRRKNPPPAVCR